MDKSIHKILVAKKKAGRIRMWSRFVIFSIASFSIVFMISLAPSCSLVKGKSPESYIESAKRFSERGEYRKAYLNYTRAIKLNPVLYSAYLDRAMVGVHIDSLERSIDDLAIYIGSNPDRESLAKAYLNCAEIKLRLGYKSDACDYFEACCSLNQIPSSCERYRLMCK